MVGIGNPKPVEELNGPEVIGRMDLYDREDHRFIPKYHAPLELHPYYEKLIEENKEDLQKKAIRGGFNLDVTQRFKEEAQRLYRKDFSAASN
ncbi:MAG: hypothetical protein ACLFN4_03960 [Candidatus Acetothermia bacterium]